MSNTANAVRSLVTPRSRNTLAMISRSLIALRREVAFQARELDRAAELLSTPSLLDTEQTRRNRFDRAHERLHRAMQRVVDQRNALRLLDAGVSDFDSRKAA